MVDVAAQPKRQPRESFAECKTWARCLHSERQLATRSTCTASRGRHRSTAARQPRESSAESKTSNASVRRCVKCTAAVHVGDTRSASWQHRECAQLSVGQLRKIAGSTANVHGNFASWRRKPTTARCELRGSLARCFAFPSASWQHGARVQLRVVDIGALPQGNLASRPRKAKLGRDVCIPSASWQHGARVQLRAVDIGALPQGNLASRPRKAKHGAHQFVDAWAA